MPPLGTRLHARACLALVSALSLAGCVSAPRMIAIPPVAESDRPRVDRSTDYQEVLAAIAFIMARDLNLPVVGGSVTFFPTQVSYEAGVVAESQRDLERLRKQLGIQARQLNEKAVEEGVIFAARRTAASSMAVGMHMRVLVNERQLTRQPWWERARVLAHELTHMFERALIEGRLVLWDRWLSEGFADWVSYAVLDRLGADTFVKSRKAKVEEIARAKSSQAFPTLTQLVTGEEWVTWLQTLGPAATYTQAFLAVDLLVERKGLPAFVEYFRLFGTLNNRERNFLSAFGEPVATFEEKFSQHLKRLTGR